MTDRHEFTAPDGSRRWCSVGLLDVERNLSRALAQCRDWVSPRETCPIRFVYSCRGERDSILKPQPSGLRWVPLYDGTMWSLADDEPHRGRRVIYHDRVVWRSRGTWVAFDRRHPYPPERIATGTLAECARALVSAVRGAK